MRAPVPTTVDRPPRVRADLAVHLSGHHDTQAVTLAGSILLVMPAARIRLAHPQPALAAHTAWLDAMTLADDLFGEGGPQTPMSWPDAAAVSGHVAFAGPVAGAAVDALAAAASPTGAAQIRVRLGGLLVIAVDRDAVRCQHALWTTAYRHAAELWPTAPADTADQLVAAGPALAPLPGGGFNPAALTSPVGR
ncbi:hypothetical protein [Catenulispora rubra]|uniref:hypothetical protein n=1 Tax=Catenulispora rubra TaxID=280293 RepID=UPI0018922F8F|nr:hypothetical protein [Catenulispora rubra]